MEWIDVKDKMPPNATDCFTVSIWEGEQYYNEAVYKDGRFEEPYYGQDMSGYHDDVTHWMIPEPPKEDIKPILLE
jgi:hypothetical protein